MLYSCKDYVCPRCFNTIDKCTCPVQPRELVNIDSGIQEQIRILNTKGYITRHCCESHDPEGGIYIAFAKDYGFEKMPSGFFYRKRTNAMYHLYKCKNDMEKFNKDKQDHLDKLLDWCNNLSQVY